MSYILSTEGIVKSFDGLVANDHIDFELNKGEFHALLGENGSGKSTFLNVLYGVWKRNAGNIFVKGKLARINSPVDAIENYRIGKVSQHSDLVPTFTVGENITFRNIPKRFGIFTDENAIANEVQELLKITNYNLQSTAVVETLSVGERQQIELLKVLAQDAEIILLDEISALLSPQETEQLISLLKSLTKKGRSVIFVTHKLNEALSCDRITVLRKGKVTLTANAKDVTSDSLLMAMFGQEISIDKCAISMPNEESKIVLEVKDLCTHGENGIRSNLKNISFNIRQGEIFGIAGVTGNGQMELLDALIGFLPASGQIIIAGENLRKNHSAHHIRKKNMIAYIPEDRCRVGSLYNLPISENMILDQGRRPVFHPNHIRRDSTIRNFAENLVSEYQVKTDSIKRRIDSLSGGNLQKTIVARELSIDATLIIAVQPSRGLDFKTTEFVHKRLTEMKEQGKAIMLVSYDLDEILKLSVRIAVMYEGSLVEVPCETSTKEISKLMVGI